MSEIIIENVTQFVEAIRHIVINDQTELFFRGHADRDYVAEPAIFRNKEHLKNEKHLFNDMITQCPEEFKDCQYTFEYLVKMQHYGLPTRLLDITSNALVALYFACCSSDDFVCDEQGDVIYIKDEKGDIKYDKNNKKIAQRKDGQVLVYQVQKDAIKNYNSDTVSVLSNLVQLDSDFEVFTKLNKEDSENLFTLKEELIENVHHTIGGVGIEQYKKLLLMAQQVEINKIYPVDEEEIYPGERDDENIIMLIRDIIRIVKPASKEKITELKPYISQKLSQYKKLNDQQERFLYFIKQEKNYFVDRIDEEKDVRKIVCVRAKLNNPRIIRQSGLFFLFGMGNTKGEPITFSEYMKGMKEHPSPTLQEIINPTILISGQAKETIIKELRALGISEETLMPEIDSVAKSIKNRYSH